MGGNNTKSLTRGGELQGKLKPGEHVRSVSSNQIVLGNKKHNTHLVNTFINDGLSSTKIDD